MKIIIYAIPVFAFSLLVEVLYFRFLKKHEEPVFDTKDTVASLSMGVGNVIAGILTRVLVFGALFFVYRFRLFETDRAAWWYWAALFFADDFSYYWFHRMSHEVRYFWASHVVHHSSRYYNLGTALRQTWTGVASGSFVFYLWMPLVGFHPVDVILMQSISLLYQFWIHTEAIGRLPRPVEFLFNTPSHHRVHHGSDVKYLDCNHGGILIIWDRIFGTFVAEQERPAYGLTSDLKTYNPVYIAFHEWKDLVADIRCAPDWRSRLYYVFGPPGWKHDGSGKTTAALKKEAVLSPSRPEAAKK